MRATLQAILLPVAAVSAAALPATPAARQPSLLATPAAVHAQPLMTAAAANPLEARSEGLNIPALSSDEADGLWIAALDIGPESLGYTWSPVSSAPTSVAPSSYAATATPTPLAEANEAVVPVRRDASDMGPEGPQCDSSLQLNADDRAGAADGFAKACAGEGYDWSRAMVYKHGSVVAYGCSYGGGQTSYQADVVGFFNDLLNTCRFDGTGGLMPGWYVKPDWAATYGFAAAGVQVCR